MNQASALHLPPRGFDLKAAHQWACRAWELFVDTFATARELMDCQVMLRREHKKMLRWLKPLEEFARRLIFIEAASMPKPNALPPQPALRRRVHYSCGKPGFAQPDPARWGVVFKVTEPPPRRAKKRARRVAPEGGRKALPSGYVYAFTLAERIEAVRRALADPTPYAQRLARRLHHDRKRTIWLRPPERNHDDLVGYEDQLDAYRLARFLSFALPPPPDWRAADTS
ncbi:MAG: hypothetical protein AB7J28_13645 [Hyphomonadaceae bacterium]